jgi:hypothetical protein
MSVTIGFRGLLVFHYMNGYMEIGVLNAAAHADEALHVAHVPRIIKTKDGIINSILDLRTRPELGNVREWEIKVTDPLQPKVTKLQEPGIFKRRNHSNLKDYRWITDLEAGDLYGRDLTADLDMNNLLMVLKVRHGEFYTHQLSKPLMRQNVTPAGPEVRFGKAAEVTACNITFNHGRVFLEVDGGVAFRFNERAEDGVVYEFSNTPPDVDPHQPYAPNGPGHFQMYNSHLFRPRTTVGPAGPERPEFNLVPEEDLTPSPDPALCGALVLGQRPGGL